MFLNSPETFQMHCYMFQQKTFIIMVTYVLHTTLTESVNNQYGGLV